jgi:hypothetical protein
MKQILAIIVLWLSITFSACIANEISEEQYDQIVVKNISHYEPVTKIVFCDIIEIDCKNFTVKYLRDDVSLEQAANESFHIFWEYFGRSLNQKGRELKMESEHKFMKIIERAIGQMDDEHTLSECIAEICLKENIDPVEVGEWIRDFKGLVQVIEHNAKKFKTLKHHHNLFETVSISEFF